MAVYQAPGPVTSKDVTRILELYRSGQMNDQELYTSLRGIGYTAELANHVVQSELAAKTKATASTETVASARTTPGTASPVVDPLAGVSTQALAERQEALSESERGRQSLFGAAVRGQYSQVNPFQDYLLSRYDPTFAQFQTERGLSNTPPSDFSQYARAAAGTNLNPDVWKAYIQTGAGLLASPQTDLPERQGIFREWLSDPNNQFDLALQSTLARTPGSFRPALRSGAQRVFEDQYVNQPEQTFLPWFVGRGQRFF